MGPNTLTFILQLLISWKVLPEPVRRAYTPPSLPDGVKRVLLTLQEAGYEAYVVGGAPRDWLLGRPVNDYDVATSAKPEEVKEVFSRVIPVGLDHGTVTVVFANTAIEVTAFRRGGNALSPAGRESDGYSDTIEEDLAARDFTINAIAWQMSDEKSGAGFLVDPYGGIEDIGEGQLRGVVNAAHRFREDPLRVLRACRQAATLDMQVEAQTLEEMANFADDCALCAVERIMVELSKLLEAANPTIGLELLEKVGLLKKFFPKTAPFEICLKAKRALPNRLAALLFVNDVKTVEKSLKKLKFSKAVATLVLSLVNHSQITPSTIERAADVRRFVSHVGEDVVAELLDLMAARELSDVETLSSAVASERASGCPFTVADLAIGGSEVMKALGSRGGPRVGAILKELLDRVLEEPRLNERNELLELLSSMTTTTEKC